MALLLACPGAHAGVAPEEPPVSVSQPFSFDKKPNDTRRSLSGIACPDRTITPRRCVAVFDEGVEARYVVLDGQSVRPEPGRIVLFPNGKELDAEGAARDGPYVFVTGSFSVKRSTCAANPDSRRVVRFSVDPANGLAQHLPNGAPADLASDEGRLWRLLTAHPTLRSFTGDNACLGGPPNGRHGVNIEGLAARNGWLYFGFRGPAVEGTAYILRVAADFLFSGGAPSHTLFTVPVGQGRGIRDLLAVPEGFLILVGPNDDLGNDAGWSIAFWDGALPGDGDGAVRVRVLADLSLPSVRQNGCDKEAKPEALAMIEDGPDFRRLLVLSDGMCDGGPLVFRVSK